MGRSTPTQRPWTRSKSKASIRKAALARNVNGKAKVLSKSRKEKKRRPKKALGPYMYYCKLNRKSVQMQNPNLNFGDIGRVLGSQWTGLEDEEKKKYVKKAQVDKRRYARELAQYAK